MEKNRPLQAQEGAELSQLISLVWRWKWLYAAVVIVFVGITALYCRSQPVLYGTLSTIKIGKIADIQIEPFADIQLYLKKYDDYAREKKIAFAAFPSVQGHSADDIRGTLVVTVIAQSESADGSRLLSEKISSDLIVRHRGIFDRARAASAKNAASSASDRLLFFLESYTFPTQKAEADRAFTVRALSDKIDNPPGSGMGMKHYLALSLLASLFLGLMLIFMCDYLVSVRRAQKS